MIKEIDRFIEGLFDQAKLISVSDIPFDTEVRKLCEQNTCGKFGSCWTCPPAIGEMEELQHLVTNFHHFLIFHKVYAIEDSFDWEGMIDSARDFQKRVLKFKKQIQAKNSEFDLLVLGAGSCMLCETCTYPKKEPCRFPDNAIFAIEAFGINAMKMMKDNGLKYNNGPNTVTYIGGLFYV